MSTDFRALCAELHEALEKRCETLKEDRLLDRSAAALRAVLAQQHVSTPYKLPEPQGGGAAKGKPFHWRNLGDGKPVQVQECPICGIAPANVDDCGRFGDPACPYFGVGEPQPVAPTESDVTELFYRHMGEGSQVGFENAIAEALARWGTPANNTREEN
jgi:hypothetical protein